MKLRKGHWVSCKTWCEKIGKYKPFAYQIAQVTKESIYVWYNVSQYDYPKDFNFFRVYRNNKKYYFDK